MPGCSTFDATIASRKAVKYNPHQDAPGSAHPRNSKLHIRSRSIMNANFVRVLRVLAVSVCVILLSISVSVSNAQEKKPQDQPKISEGEQQAINKINTASGADAKLKAAAEFVKKNSK